MQSGQWGKLLVHENYCKPLEKKSQTVEPVASSAPRGTVESNPNARAKRRTETQPYSSENGVNRSNCQRFSKRSETTAGASLSYTQPPSSQHSSASDLAYARDFGMFVAISSMGGTRAMQARTSSSKQQHTCGGNAQDKPLDLTISKPKDKYLYFPGN